jgi:hypothetical protein
MTRANAPATAVRGAVRAALHRTVRARLRAMRAAVPGALALAGLAALFSCHRGPHALAVVGGHSLTVSDLASTVMAQTGKTIDQVAPEVVSALFENRLEEEVVLAASPDADDWELPSALRSARARELLASLCPVPPQPSAAEIEDYMAHHPAATSAERILVRQLILPDEETARQARGRVSRGEDFVALSHELSRAPNADDGGVIGWVEKGQLPPEFEAVVFGLAPGQTSEPVASNAGWHVFQVVQRVPPGTPDAALRERTRAELAARVAEASRRACVHRLAAKVGVEVQCEGAHFPCRNPFEELP